MPTTNNTHLSQEESNRIVSFTDETRFINMIRNRPSLNLIAHANRRILAQKTGTHLFALSIVGATLLGLLVNQYQEGHSLSLYNTRKSFSFKSDPYSGTVKCNSQDVPYRQHGY